MGARDGPEFFEAAFMRVPAGIAFIGVDGRMLGGNPAYCEMVGVTVEEVIGADATAFVHPDDIDAAISASIEQIDFGRAAAARPRPIRIVRPDGGIVWVKFDSLLIEDGPGDPYVLATMTDVSEQVESEGLEKGLVKLNKTMVDAATGKNKDVALLFQRMGISLRDSREPIHSTSPATAAATTESTSTPTIAALIPRV